MNTCIRCGLQVNWDQTSHMFLTQDGAYSCNASLPGEAGIHRVDALPPKRSRGRGIARTAAQAGLGWAAGRVAGDLLGRVLVGPPAEKNAMQVFAALNPEGAADLRARGSRY